MILCPTHPRYQAKLKPRLACEGCWRAYIEEHPGCSICGKSIPGVLNTVILCASCGTE